MSHATTRTGGDARRVVAAVGALAMAFAVGSCGDDDEGAEPTATPPTQQEQAAPGGGEREGAEEEEQTTTAGETERVETFEDETAVEDGACTYRAPPGRLAEDEIVVSPVGVDCDQGRSLARAVSLGQPAGANLVITKDGFECEPSTRARGANVTYTCTRGAARVSFDVVWSAG